MGAYSSQPSSPTYEMREASGWSGPMTMGRQVLKGKPALDISASVTACSTSRARGPHTPSVHQAEVWSLMTTEPSSGR